MLLRRIKPSGISGSDLINELYREISEYKYPKAGGEIYGSVLATSSITVYGNISAGSIFYARYNDYAEYFKSEFIYPNHIYAYNEDGCTLATKKDKVIAGIFSTSNAPAIGNPKGSIPLCLFGRVEVITLGEVRKGDYLTVSDTPGYAERYDGSGEVLGVALRDTYNGITRILVI